MGNQIVGGWVNNRSAVTPHECIDQRGGILLTPCGQMEIDRGGLDVGMAQVALDQADVDALVQRWVA